MTALRLKRAIELLRQPGHHLMLLHEKDGSLEYYVVPGGRVDRADAAIILARPDICPSDDGLFPGISQTWKIG